MDSVLALNPADPGSILGIPENFSLDVAEIYKQQQHYLVQWTEAYVD